MICNVFFMDVESLFRSGALPCFGVLFRSGALPCFGVLFRSGALPCFGPLSCSGIPDASGSCAGDVCLRPGISDHDFGNSFLLGLLRGDSLRHPPRAMLWRIPSAPSLGYFAANPSGALLVLCCGPSRVILRLGWCLSCRDRRPWRPDHFRFRPIRRRE